MPDDRVLIVMWGATFPSESSVEGMLDADRRAYDGWAGLIERGQRDSSIRRDADARASAVILHGMLRGVAALLLTESAYTDMTNVGATVDRWIAAALEPRSVAGAEEAPADPVGDRSTPSATVRAGGESGRATSTGWSRRRCPAHRRAA
jgi:hypothetical protein